VPILLVIRLVKREGLSNPLPDIGEAFRKKRGRAVLGFGNLPRRRTPIPVQKKIVLGRRKLAEEPINDGSPRKTEGV